MKFERFIEDFTPFFYLTFLGGCFTSCERESNGNHVDPAIMHFVKQNGALKILRTAGEESEKWTDRVWKKIEGLKSNRPKLPEPSGPVFGPGFFKEKKW